MTTITLTTTEVITLPPDLTLDPPRSQWQEVAAESAWSRGGKKIVWTRPRKDIDFNLKSIDMSAWMTTEIIDKLYASVIIGGQYPLDYHGTVYPVEWRIDDWPCILHAPVINYAQPISADKNKEIVLKFVWKRE